MVEIRNSTGNTSEVGHVHGRRPVRCTAPVFLRCAIAAALVLSVLGTAAPVLAQTTRSTYYDGSPDGYVVYVHQARFDSSVAMTVEAWIRPLSFGLNPTIVSRDSTSSYWFGLHVVSTTQARLRFYRSGGIGASSTGTIEVHRWTHVAAVYDGTWVHFFIDGVHAGTEALSNAGAGINTPLYIGGHDGGCCSDPAGLSFQGMINEVRIWSLARTGGQLAGGMFDQLRGVAGLAAAFDTGGMHEDLNGSVGTNGGGASLRMEGMIPQELVVPAAALPGNMIVDGAVDLALEYVGGEQMVVRYAVGSGSSVGYAVAHMAHTDTDLYIGVKIVSVPKVGWHPDDSWFSVMFDRDYSRDAIAQPDDFLIRANLGSLSPAWLVGNGAGSWVAPGVPPPAGDWDVAKAPCGEFGEQCFEFRIAKSQLGEWNETDGIAIGHVWLGGFGDNYLAPGGAVRNAPNTWGTLQYDEAGPVLPRAMIAGIIPEGKCDGGERDLSTCSHDRECPDGDCILEGRTVWLMSSLRDEPLYTLTTNTNGGFLFNEGSSGVIVPPLAHITVQAEGCTGCLYPDATLHEGDVATSGIRALALHGLNVTFEGPCDACPSVCGTGSTCFYPEILFAIRQPPGPLTVTDITPDALRTEIVLRDSPRKVLPGTQLTIRGQNLHEFIDVYLDGRCLGFPDFCERVPLVIVERGSDETGDWIVVELREEPPRPPLGGWGLTIHDRWSWGRAAAGVRGWLNAGRVQPEPFPAFPLLWGFEFANRGDSPGWGDFSSVFGTNAFICAGIPLPDHVCAGCWVPSPSYLLYFAVYAIAMETGNGSCVGMAATSELFRHGNLIHEDLQAGVHFSNGFSGEWDGSARVPPKPGQFGFDLCGPWGPRNLWAHIRTNHGVQFSAEFLRETFDDMHSGSIFSLDGDPVALLPEFVSGTPTQVISAVPSLGSGHAVVPYGVEPVDGMRCDGGCDDLAPCTTDADCPDCDSTCSRFDVNRCPTDTTGSCDGGTCVGGCKNGPACALATDCPDCDAGCPLFAVNECGDPETLIGVCRQFTKIHIYDNNYPENENRTILIDEARNRYRFVLGGRTVWRGRGLYSIPISVWQNPRTGPGLLELADFLTVWSIGSADALYTDSEGGEWGWRPDGTVVETMPNVVASPPLEDVTSLAPTRNIPLLIPVDLDPPRTRLNFRGGDFIFHAALGGTTVQLEGIGVRDDDGADVLLTKDVASLTAMRFTSGKGGTNIIPKLGMILRNDREVVYQWIGLRFGAREGGLFETLSDLAGVAFENDTTTPKSFYLLVEHIDGEDEEHGRSMFGPIVVPGGARHWVAVVDWPTFSQLESNIDLDRDGVVDNVETLNASRCDDLSGGPAIDLDRNGVPDSCENLGDTNGDVVVDLSDYRALWKCVRGPTVPYPEPNCSAVDFDFDSDVDLKDVARFLRLFSPGQADTHDCCTPGTAGCDDARVEACVCLQQPSCCETEWDESCVTAVDRLTCGSCGTYDHDCCTQGGPNCDTPAVAACVCAQDAFCCDDVWDEQCIAEVDIFGCGFCTGLPDCCLPAAGCGNPGIAECVCARDSFCCDVEWDQRCVDLVDRLGCGSCVDHACCITGGPGCKNETIEACVCEFDPACCTAQWDRLCIEEIDTFACGSCGSHSCCDEGSLGCDDSAVLACVCAQDPFCCTTGWDRQCIDEISDLGCGSCSNDLCQNAEILDVPSSFVGYTSDALHSNAPSCDGVDNDTPGRWYVVFGNGSDIIASTCNDFNEFDTRISVYEGDCDALSCVAANDDDCHIAGRSTVQWCSMPGVRYWILVHGAPDQVGGFYLTVSDGPVCIPIDAFVHTSNQGNTLGNTTDIDRPSTNGLENALVFATQRVGEDSPNGPFNNSPIGIWYTGSKWSMFSQDGAAMPIGAAFSIAVIPPSVSTFVEVAQQGDTGFNSTRINNAGANGNPNAIIMLTQNWNPGGLGGTYNNTPVGVWYDGSFWKVFNENLSNMPLDAAFNVTVLEESDNAFVHTATQDNTGGAVTWIDRPATNGKPDAIVLVTQNWNPGGVGGVYNNAPIAAQYVSGLWLIINEDASNMPLGASFNVLVLPASPN